MNRVASHSEQPSRWPFPPPSRYSRGSAAQPALRTILADICLVAAWAAMIPGLMWLGVAGGF